MLKEIFPIFLLKRIVEYDPVWGLNTSGNQQADASVECSSKLPGTAVAG